MWLLLMLLLLFRVMSDVLRLSVSLLLFFALSSQSVDGSVVDIVGFFLSGERVVQSSKTALTSTCMVVAVVVSCFLSVCLVFCCLLFSLCLSVFPPLYFICLGVGYHLFASYEITCKLVPCDTY